MARARLKNTGKALGKRGRPAQQPTCDKCGKPIEVGEQRYEWSFRYGGTYTRHAEQGPNQERAESCESWAEKLRDASSEVANVEVEVPDEIEELDEDADEDETTEHQEALDKRDDELEEAVTAAKDEVRSTAEDAIYDLEL
jgi:hypothetical protein